MSGALIERREKASRRCVIALPFVIPSDMWARSCVTLLIVSTSPNALDAGVEHHQQVVEAMRRLTRELPSASIRC